MHHLTEQPPFHPMLMRCESERTRRASLSHLLKFNYTISTLRNVFFLNSSAFSSPYHSGYQNRVGQWALRGWVWSTKALGEGSHDPGHWTFVLQGKAGLWAGGVLDIFRYRTITSLVSRSPDLVVRDMDIFFPFISWASISTVFAFPLFAFFFSIC